MDTALAMDWAPEGATYYQYQVSVAGCPGNPAATNSGRCYSFGARADIDGDGVFAERILVRPSTGAAPVRATQPAVVTIAFPGEPGNNCEDANGTRIDNMFCSITHSDKF
jgi:hypothetical protein